MTRVLLNTSIVTRLEQSLGKSANVRCLDGPIGLSIVHQLRTPPVVAKGFWAIRPGGQMKIEIVGTH